MKYEIWQEGYAATGESGIASKVGEGEGETFEEAVLDWVSKHMTEAASMSTYIGLKHGYLDYDKYTNPAKVTFWGCRVFPTEAEARKSFG